jgi:hypothetical protein
VTHYTSVLSQKFMDEIRDTKAVVLQPREGRKIVAHGVSRGKNALPRLRHPSPAGAGEGMGEREGTRKPTACAMGYIMPPVG